MDCYERYMIKTRGVEGGCSGPVPFFLNVLSLNGFSQILGGAIFHSVAESQVGPRDSFKMGSLFTENIHRTLTDPINELSPSTIFSCKTEDRIFSYFGVVKVDFWNRPLSKVLTQFFPKSRNSIANFFVVCKEWKPLDSRVKRIVRLRSTNAAFLKDS